MDGFSCKDSAYYKEGFPQDLMNGMHLLGVEQSLVCQGGLAGVKMSSDFDDADDGAGAFRELRGSETEPPGAAEDMGELRRSGPQ